MPQPSNADQLKPRLLEAVELERSEELFPAILGSLAAAACADALGWVTEFMRSPASLQRRLGVNQLTDYVAWRKEVGGRFNTYIDYIGPGEYSDDTQLTLAVARSIRADGSVDQRYFVKEELFRWLDYARGAGRTVIAAARAAGRKRTPWNRNFFKAGKLNYWDSGANGAAMRIAPIALANLDRPRPPMESVFGNSIATHGHPRAHVGALAYAAALYEILRRRDGNGGTRAFLAAVIDHLRDWRPADAESPEVQEWLTIAESNRPGWRRAYAATIDEFRDMLRIVERQDTRAVLEELGCFARDTAGSGTATVAAALHLFCLHGANVERSVVEAVNAIPADTDTIGAFVGSMSGLYGGYEAVPEPWTARLQDHPYIVGLAESLSHIAGRDTSFEGSLRARPSMRERDLPDVMEQLRHDELSPDDRVRHDVLGSGTVRAIHAQTIRRRAGGQMVYARVELDIGQQCQFRAHLPSHSATAKRKQGPKPGSR